GPPGAAAHGRNLREVHQKALGDQAEPIGLGKGDAGVVSQTDVERALAKGGQEGARQVEGRSGSGDDCEGCGNEDQGAPGQSPGKEGCVGALGTPEKVAVVITAATASKQII